MYESGQVYYAFIFRTDTFFSLEKKLAAEQMILTIINTSSDNDSKNWSKEPIK